MAVITSGKTFANGEQLTADKLNQVITGATFNATEAVDNSTTQIDGSGAIVVRDGGITTAKILDSNVTKAKIENVADMKVLGNTSGSAAAPQEVSVLDEDDMSSDSATSLATQQSIKAYVDGFRPKFVSLTGGTTDLTKQNQSNGTTVTYSIADFTSGDSDFGTGKIVGLVVDGYVASTQNTNRIQVSLPNGTNTTLVRVAAFGGNDHCESQSTFTVPVNSDTSSVTFTYEVGDTSPTLYNQTVIKGVIIQPSL